MRKLYNRLGISIVTFMCAILLITSSSVAQQNTAPFYIILGESNAGWTPINLMSPQQAAVYAGTVPRTTIWNPGRGGFSAKLEPMNVGVNTMCENFADPTQFGPEASFFKALQDQLPRQRFIYKQGQANSSLLIDWKPVPLYTGGDGTRFSQLSQWLPMAVAQATQQGYKLDLRGVIWIAGENDAKIGRQEQASAYLKGLYDFFNGFDALWQGIVRQYNLPNTSYKKVIGRLYAPGESFPYRNLVRQAQMDYCAVPANNALWIDTDRYPLFDYAHYDATGMIQYGWDIFNAHRFETSPDLSNLVLSQGTLSPSFNPSISAYTAQVPSQVASISVSPTLADPTSSVAVNGLPVGSGNSSAPIQLNPGYNTINVTVTAQDGSTKNYTITVEKAAAPISSNNNLSNLLTSAGALSPAFSAGILSYTINVGSNVSAISITPTAEDPAATIRVEGMGVANGGTTAPIVLNTGANTITTVVTAADQSMKGYTITVNKAAPVSSNNNLSNLFTSAGGLSPAFNAGTLAYTINVGSEVATIAITPTAEDPSATIRVEGMGVASGGTSAPIVLNTGTNTITTVVTASDQAMKGYTITVIKAAPASSNNNLSNLTTSAGGVSPAFNAGITDYTLNVGNNVASISVTPTVEDPGATITIDGSPVASGGTSAPINLNTGNTTISIVITAPDQSLKGYAIIVNRAAPASSNNNLSNLTTSAGGVSPAFNAGITDYTLNVGSNVGSISVTPTVEDPGATITVDGSPVASGGTSAPINLNTGNTTISIVITAPDQSLKGYAIIVNRAAPASSNNNLSNLTTSAGGVSPAFNAGITDYTLNVGSNVGSISVTPTVEDPGATITVDGSPVASGGTSAPINLNTGNTTISIVITAPDQSLKGYAIIVNRAAPASSNNNLSNLTTSAGGVSPAFNAGITDYTLNVGSNVRSISVTPTVEDPGATITVDGNRVASGGTSAPINLNTGNTTISIVVTAPDQSTKGYAITVNKAAVVNANNNLSNLAVSAGSLSPAFSSGTTAYNVSVGSSTGSITITPTAEDPAAMITVDGIGIASGGTSAPITLSPGNRTINIVVTAQDQSVKTYSVTVNKAAVVSSNNNLSNLVLSAGSVSPSFSSGTTGYNVSVGSSTGSITLTPTAEDPAATITIDGTPIASGGTSAPITLNTGNRTINIVVTAQDQSVKTYSVTVNKAAVVSSNNNLSNLVLSTGSLSPAFSSGTTGYNVSVGSTTGSITLTPTAEDPAATITIDGTPIASGGTSAPITLNTGNRTINIVVTAQDQSIKTYSVTVNKAAVVSSNNNLSNLVLSTGSLSPSFSSGTTSYNVSIGSSTGSITLTPTAEDPAATITVDGIGVASGATSAPITLNTGNRTINIIVTAQDQSVKTYSVTVNKAAVVSSNNNLSNLVLSAGSLSPSFSSGTTSYNVSVSSSTTSMTIIPTAEDAAARITVDGNPVASGGTSAPINLNTGNNTITIAVTAQDQSVKTYTVRVSRTADLSNNNNLVNVLLSAGTLSPSFAAAQTSYTAGVGSSVASITVTPTAEHPRAKITVNGSLVSSGSASGPITLNTGNNTINIVVTAEDLSTKSYTIIVNKATPLSSNNNLLNITLSQGVLSPSFSTSVLLYTASVPATVSTLSVTALTQDANASMTINALGLVSGNASAPINLLPGANVITIIVTAQDLSIRTYVITVMRAIVQMGATIPDMYAVNPGGSANTIYLGYGPSTLTLTAQPNGGLGGNTYKWSTGATTQSIVVNPSKEGTYNYTVTVRDNFGNTATAVKSIKVIDITCGNNKVAICKFANGNSGVSNSLCLSSNAVEMQLGNGAMLGACPGQPIDRINIGAQISGLPTSVTGNAVQEFNNNSVSVRSYPNPSTGMITVYLDQMDVKTAEIQIVDKNGTIVARKKWNGSKSGNTFDLTNQASGMYLVKVITNRGVEVSKISLQH
ncbi:cadherin-like beta sandwich domain-containing protein [Segetibacter sp. 3557_3]|uniref:cadherin-like beta sandwich domain-containing protein n=1 Tax=Segetibacter sp. 3557_3 TaxID=2547429 RepID=UPI001404E7C3|nr:cadherin-like beta sandwich domain-containing protein [Segetibacter sp. 3557_3]